MDDLPTTRFVARDWVYITLALVVRIVAIM
jgi:hypothetical protein